MLAWIKQWNTHAKSDNPASLAIGHHGIDILLAERLGASEGAQRKVGDAAQERDRLCVGKQCAAAQDTPGYVLQLVAEHVAVVNILLVRTHDLRLRSAGKREARAWSVDGACVLWTPRRHCCGRS